MNKPTKQAISDELELRKNVGRDMSNLLYNLSQIGWKEMTEDEWKHWQSLFVPLYRAWDLINHGE